MDRSRVNAMGRSSWRSLLVAKLTLPERDLKDLGRPAGRLPQPAPHVSLGTVEEGVVDLDLDIGKTVILLTAPLHPH